MDKKTLKDIDVKGKKVLVRVDYNVPVDESGNITDDTRITASLPTLNYLLGQGASLILMAHFGRPKGKVNSKYSLRFVAQYLGGILKKQVKFADDCVGEQAAAIADKLNPGEILMLENLRFHSEEEANDPEFSEKLAALADIYVNDGFGVSHRAHASVEGVTHFLPAVAGMLLEKEIKFVGQAVANPQRPFAAIIGGAKVSDKIGVIDNLIDKVDVLVIGGGMANTFLAAQGKNMGKSLVEPDKYTLATELIAKAQAKNVKLLLPVDMVVAEAFAEDAKNKVCDIDSVPAAWMALDIGPKTCQIYAEALKNMQQIVWNGPMGVFEMKAFCGGTEAVAKAVAGSKAISIVGGGDSVAAIEKLGLAENITHISTGGGASLEYLEGKVLPGIDSLDDLRRPLIAGNWKMNKTVPEALELVKELVQLTGGAYPEVVVLPPFTAIEAVADAIDGQHIGYGGQNMHWEEWGAYTGGISGRMLADIGCEYVLLGHSERRQYCGEGNMILTKKLTLAFTCGLKPIFCVGEMLAEREAGQHFEIIAEQLSILNNFTKENLSALTIAYEPVWAIGTGKTASKEDAQAMCAHIRKYLLNNIGEQIARNTRILYGGSVNESTIKDLMSEPDIDGALVGGASLKAESFAKIVRY